MWFRYKIFLLGLLTTSTYSYPTSDFQKRCQSLSEKIELDYTFDVNIAGYLAPNSTIDLVAEGVNATCLESYGNSTGPLPVGICRLNLRVATSENSEVYAEVWLPENWEGRTLMTGNGGLDGCMSIS
jgi:feruloyl esterase